jgi:lysophospholipase L1-like esterase
MNRALLVLALAAATSSARADDFFLKENDRVVFYGDSITAQRLYTAYVETYVTTRFPGLGVRFVHSGWGGDTVTGGGGGKIDKRLERDVIAYKPTVVTCMLGMNDAGYGPLDDDRFAAYRKGYEHIVATLKEKLPGVRLVLLGPSPYDDVTRHPTFEGGYNEVLKKYGDFVRELAGREKALFVDLNGPVVECLVKANDVNPAPAIKVIEDRVHPGPGGHLVMARALLEAWHAPALVSGIEVDAAKKELVHADNVEVKDLAALSWTARERSLPFPFDVREKTIETVAGPGRIVDTLDREMLTVTGLAEPAYELWIDEQRICTYDKDDLEKGVNIACLETPMLAQARKVQEILKKHGDIHEMRWHVGVKNDGDESPHFAKALAELDAWEEDVLAEVKEHATPKAHSFKLVPASK